jgi:hypothetical protein
MLEEVFLHHLTRYAVEQAMEQGFPCIYAGFYAYDETGHGFGPQEPYTRHMLRHIDHSIRAAGERRRGANSYQLVVLSDHGQVQTEPFATVAGLALGELVAGRLPGARIEVHNGGTFGARSAAQMRVVIAASGGLSHLYFADFPDRLDAVEVRRRFPGFVEFLARLPGVGLVLMRDGDREVALTRDGERPLEHAVEPYGSPAVLVPQLRRLNGFEAAGDVLLFGRWDSARSIQVNFEDQNGGHGSIGGDQGEPFLLVDRSLGIDTSAVVSADALHPILWDLRRRSIP